MITSLYEAVREMSDFGLDIDTHNVKTDTSNVVRVKFVEGKRNNIDGFYQIFTYGAKVCGYYGSWWGGRQIKVFKSDGSESKLSQAQVHEFKKKVANQKKQMENYEPDLSVWKLAQPCTSHPYLEKKGIDPNDVNVKIAGEELLIPYQNKSSEVVGVQRITKDGGKFMIKGSKMKGAFHVIEGNDIHAICEGWATGISINKATGWTVVCAYSASNLNRVAGYFKHKAMIICADNDLKTVKKTGSNPGLEAGQEASKRCFAPLVYPPNDDHKTDFNDWPLETIKPILLDKTPKTILQQLSEIDALNDQEKKIKQRDFLDDRRELLANFETNELSKLKRNIKDLHDIPMSFIEEIKQGVKSEEQMERQEESIEEFKRLRVFEKGFYFLENERFFRTTQQNVTLLLNNCSDCPEKRADLLKELHRDREVQTVYVEATPDGKSRCEEFLGLNQKFVIKQYVSIREGLESRLAELDSVEIDMKFIEYLRTEYPEIIDLWDASLARKFAHHKKSIVYLNVNSNYGKTFLLGIESLAMIFEGVYEKDDLKGNDPEDFVRPILFCVDEAEKFPSIYKLDTVPYRKLYEGLVHFDLGVRVLACANPMSDLEEGVDEQIENRVLVMKPQPKTFSHQGIDQKTSHLIWEKWLLSRFRDTLSSWGDDYAKKAQASYDEFVKMYSDDHRTFIPLDQIALGHLTDLFFQVYSHDGRKRKSFKGLGGIDFSDFMTMTDEGDLIITSPKKFFEELMNFFDKGRAKAFKKRFGTAKLLEEIDWLVSGNFGPKVDRKRGVLIKNAVNFFGSEKCSPDVHREQKRGSVNKNDEDRA